MTKQLYEEALADVKKLKEVAEANATRALLDAVTPRIKELIENQLLGESTGVEEEEEADSDEVLTDKSSGTDEGKNESDSESENEGDDVTESDVYELNSESIKTLGSLITNNRTQTLSQRTKSLGEQVARLKSASKIIRESAGYADAIRSVISDVEDTYSQIQENLDGSSSKKDLEAVLEGYYQTLNQLTERTMNRKNRLNEAEITLKLGGIPDEMQDKLEDLDVTIVSGGDAGSEEEDSDEDLDLGGEESDEEGGDEDLDLDLGGDEVDEKKKEGQMESRRLDDDTVVEIDEGMLRREISRMKALREEKAPSSKGNGPGKVAAGFEEDDLGDPIVDIDLREAEAHEAKGEDHKDEMDQAEEMDEMDQAEDTAEYGGVRDEAQSSKQSRQPGHTVEGIRSRLAAEARLQFEAKQKAQQAKKMQAKKQQEAQQKAKQKKQQEAQKAKKQAKKMQEAYAFYATRYNESVARSRRLQSMLNEAARKGSTLNGAPARSAAETDNLRNKLAETNLFNAKLLFTNKLLQNEALTKRQKAEVIERLDEARSEREVKLVYESLVKTLAGSTNRTISESSERGVIGSSSRPARPSSSTSTLNEGFEAERWAKLAGIVK